MVCPRPHLVKNEFQSITNESHFIKRKRGVMLWPLCNQTVNLEADAKTLNYCLLKLKHNPSIYFKHKKY